MTAMRDSVPSTSWQPINTAERYAALDVVRGIALFGVLLVNLLSDFRVPLAEHILHANTESGWVDRATGLLVVALVEFKAFTLFSLLFGVGIAIFADRASARGMSATVYLVRRLLILLLLGLCHLFLI